MNLQGKKAILHDMSLRDGMHAKRHQISLDEMVAVATALDEAGMPMIEVTHGDGLGGASLNYGFPAHSDEAYLGAVLPKMKQAKVSALLLHGIGTVDHLLMAKDLGVSCIRVATHCTEADVSQQHISKAADLGLDTVGFLMMAHMVPSETIVAQAKLMEGYGANCIYCTDSAGYMLPDEVSQKIGALRQALKSETEIGFGHKSQLGFDFRVDEFVIHNRAAVGHAEIVGQKAVARLGNAHLAHFRPRGEPHFHAHDFGAACFFAAADRPLNVKRILIIHIGKIIGDFGHFESLQFGVFQVLGQFCNLQDV